ncbi:hypothetical protein PQX77_018148, partial [Marasmius sp. AFHP31]
MAHWVTRPSCHHNPVLHEEFYLDELNRPDSPSIWDYQHDDSELDEYFGWDEVAGYTDLDLHRRSQPLRSTLAMLTLHFWDEAPDGQWPVVKLVQEFYKEIYPAHPDGVMAGDLPYHRLWRLATLSSTVSSPDGFMALLLQHFILARHTCPAAVFFLSQSDPAQAFLFEPTALSEESYNELTRITPLVE